MLFVAVTVTVYDVPLVAPVTWQAKAGVAGAVEVEVQVLLLPELGLAVAV